LSQHSEGELVFVVGVSSFTKRGFIGSASYRGQAVDIEFDDGDNGVFLTPEMCEKLHVKKGSKVLLVVEAEDKPTATEATLAGAVPRPRISSAKVYYGVGREGGAILKVRKAS
jgi:ABC-type lipoprotein release transport system permease subunit